MMLRKGRIYVAMIVTGTFSGMTLGARHYISKPTFAAAAHSRGDVVLVTGASGFVGQHIVKLLQQRATGIKEIRVFDVQPFQQSLDYTVAKPIKVFQGDVTRVSDIRDAMKGVDVVIHTAAIIDVTSRPDKKKMTSVNVEGTKNIVRACQEANVDRLVYTSTCDIIVGHDDVIDADESTPIPDKLLFPGYSNSKKHAETLVLRAHSTTPGNLKTISLRTGAMYGEEDQIYITGALKGAQKNKGVLYPLGKTQQALIQNTYAGNFAWAHVLAAEKLNSDVTIGGQAYVITDDTPTSDITSFLAPFVKSRGFNVSDKKIPFAMVYIAVWLLEVVEKVVSPFYYVMKPTTTASLTYLSHSHTYKRNKAEEKLGYEPLYNHKEALANSMRYYNHCDLNEKED